MINQKNLESSFSCNFFLFQIERDSRSNLNGLVFDSVNGHWQSKYCFCSFTDYSSIS